MRLTSLLTLAGGLLLVPTTMFAQDEADTVVTVDTVDGSDDRSTPGRRVQGPNPYLREVRESRAVRRGPWYASFGAGVGSEAIAELGAPAPYTDARVRPTLSAGIGANVGESLRLGLDGFVWFNPSGNGEVESVTTLMLGGRVYPIPSSGLYVRAAGGFGRYGIDITDDCGCSSTLVSDYGLA
jgi:hypothetical protein